MYRIIGADGQPYGPLSAEQIRRYMAEHRVNEHTLTQVEGTPDWKPLSALPEFAADCKIPPPLVSPGAASPPSSNPRASAKVPAGVCGILLGGWGVHKFVLGYTGAGIVMLLISLLTCFVGYPIMHLLGLIEGIIYMAKSDDEFVRTYVDNRREWF